MRPTYMLFHLTPGKQYIKGLKPHEPKVRTYSFSQPFTAILKIWQPQCTAIVGRTPPDVYQNALVNSVCEKVYCIRCLFYFSSVPLLTFINTKGNMCQKNSPCFWWIETLILSLHVSCNKQGHIINRNIPVALRCVTFFSHTCKWAYLSSFLIQKSF